MEDEETAVLAQVFNEYTRVPSALGGYKAETFAFANGGPLLGRSIDPSVDKATFNQVVRLISPALTRQNYIAATDPEDTDLLVYVFWGATEGIDGSLSHLGGNVVTDWDANAARSDDANRQRDRSNYAHAALLGYREAIANHISLRAFGVHGSIYDELVDDVEEARYFVVLTAFDFKTAWHTKHLIPLWSVRYNIPARGNHFTAALPGMSLFASRFFGRDSGGLVRRLNPTGKVDMADIQMLGVVEEPEK